MNEKLIKVLNGIKEHLEYHNNMAPFPVYDTGYVRDVEQRIENMEQAKTNYDELPVAACKYCNSLWVENDEVENDVCMRCGSVNELTIYKDIDDYIERTNTEEDAS